MLSFSQYMVHKDTMNHLKHKLKTTLSDEERQNVYNEIEQIRKMMMGQLSVLQPGISEDAAAAVSTGPTNVVSSGAIAGTGGKGGEPGVYLKKKKPIMMKTLKRNYPTI
jgi:hypothetical protein